MAGEEKIYSKNERSTFKYIQVDVVMKNLE